MADVAGNERTVDLRQQPIHWDLMTGSSANTPSLAPGTYVHLAGYETSGDVLASVVSYELPGAKPIVSNQPPNTVTESAANPGPPPVPVPVGLPGGVIPNIATRTYVYRGIASVYSCPTQKGRCGACNTGNSLQCAYPALDSACNCCSPTCCNCAQNCVSMVYLSCGTSVLQVYDYCSTKRYQLTVVDCGPCANPTCHTMCSATTCSHVSACGTTNFMSAIVDLTTPTFARFENPASRTSFPCDVSVTVAI